MLWWNKLCVWKHQLKCHRHAKQKLECLFPNDVACSIFGSVFWFYSNSNLLLWFYPTYICSYDYKASLGFYPICSTSAKPMYISCTHCMTFVSHIYQAFGQPFMLLDTVASYFYCCKNTLYHIFYCVVICIVFCVIFHSICCSYRLCR